MNLEKLIYRMAKDNEFAKSLVKDMKSALVKEGYCLSDNEIDALQAVLQEIEITDRAHVSGIPTHDWYRVQFHDWYAEQFRQQEA